MPKGYWVARVDVRDAAAYQDYVAANGAAFAQYGGRFIIRGGTFECPEGAARQRNVVIEFPSYQAALDCYKSDLYQAALRLRLGAGEGDVIIIEGYDGPQPA